MCLDTVTKIHVSPVTSVSAGYGFPFGTPDPKSRFGYKWMDVILIRKKTRYVSPIFGFHKMALDRWYSSSSSLQLSGGIIAQRSSEDYVPYEAGFHIYPTIREARKSRFSIGLAAVLVKVEARDIVAEGKEGPLRVFCARKMKIVKVMGRDVKWAVLAESKPKKSKSKKNRG